jgi:hypothetical protein
VIRLLTGDCRQTLRTLDAGSVQACVTSPPSDVDLAYCAGLIDGEGCIMVKRGKAYRHLTGRINPSYIASVQVRMVDEGAIRFLRDTLGGWYWREKPHLARGRPLYCWQIQQAAAESALRLLRPYLRVKHEQADNALALRRLQADRNSHRTKLTGYRNFPNQYGTSRKVANRAYSDEYMAQCEALYLRSRELNRVGKEVAL